MRSPRYMRCELPASVKFHDGRLAGLGVNMRSGQYDTFDLFATPKQPAYIHSIVRLMLLVIVHCVPFIHRDVLTWASCSDICSKPPLGSMSVIKPLCASSSFRPLLPSVCSLVSPEFLWKATTIADPRIKLEPIMDKMPGVWPKASFSKAMAKSICV